MNRLQRYAAWVLLCAFALAIGTPVYLSYAGQDLASYLLHAELLVLQALPYVVCAAVWLPRRTPGAAPTALGLALALLAAGGVLYVPMLLQPEKLGGDMVGLLFLLISIATTIVLLLVSLFAILLIRQHTPASSG